MQTRRSLLLSFVALIAPAVKFSVKQNLPMSSLKNSGYIVIDGWVLKKTDIDIA